MFNASKTIESEYDLFGEYVTEYNLTLEEAILFVENSTNSQIETKNGTIVFEDGQWLIQQEAARALATKEEADAEELEKAEEEAARKEKETINDNIDIQNISFILSIAHKFNAKDYGAHRAGDAIRKVPGWSSCNGFRGTETTITKDDRKYLLSMWKGTYTVERITN